MAPLESPRRLIRAACWLACTALASAALAQAARAATVEGVVRLSGEVPEPKSLAVTSDQYVCGTSKTARDLMVSADRGVAGAVVHLRTPPPGTRLHAFGPPPQIDQEACVFLPRMVIVPVGGTVEFLNSDRLLHNIRSKNAKKNRAFNRTQPRGRTIAITFTEPEFIRIGCDLHPWMRSWVIVADHPFYSITGADGRFALHDVPPGEHTVSVWHEVLGTQTRTITVGADGVSSLTVELASP